MITNEEIGYGIIFIGAGIWYVIDQLRTHKAIRYLSIAEEKERLYLAIARDINVDTEVGRAIYVDAITTDFSNTDDVIEFIKRVKADCRYNPLSLKRILGDDLFDYFKTVKI